MKKVDFIVLGKGCEVHGNRAGILLIINSDRRFYNG